MTTQMIVRIESGTKKKLSKLARAEGKSVSQVVRELIEQYIRERDMANYMDDLWERVGKKLRDRNVGPEEIEKAIREVRASKR